MAQTLPKDQTQIDASRVFAIVSYLTVVGWLIALIINGRNRSCLTSFHLRQSLGLILTAALLSFIPLIGWLLNVVVLLFWLIAIYRAFLGERYCVPIVGFFYQEKLAFIR
ncbi:DUF4870 domain-containing protein [Thalassotalea fusca]